MGLLFINRRVLGIGCSDVAGQLFGEEGIARRLCLNALDHLLWQV